MESNLKRYWMIVSVMFAVNLVIYLVLSRLLEIYVINHIIDTQAIINPY